MNKITTEIRYNDITFNIIKHAYDLTLLISEDKTVCIIINSDNQEVLFEILADVNQGEAFLKSI
jgi:hypothetical protein